MAEQIDRAYYEAMSRDELIARLKVAEDALTLIGWYSMAKVPDFCDPDRHVELDAMIPTLAATRDRIRAETLRHFGLDDGETDPGSSA